MHSEGEGKISSHLSQTPPFLCPNAKRKKEGFEKGKEALYYSKREESLLLNEFQDTIHE